MGNLQSFDDSTDYYVNLWRCMAKPLGTGVWFEYKGYSYVVDKVESGKKYGVINYRGVADLLDCPKNCSIVCPSFS